MVANRKKKQQNKRVFSQLGEADTDFMIGQTNHGVQIESRDNMADSGTSLDNADKPNQVNFPQADMHTLEENKVSKVRSDADSVMTTVENRVQDAVLNAVESLVVSRVELALKSANASSGRSVDGNVLEPDQRDLSGNIESLQMTDSSRINSHRDLIKVDETPGNSAIEVGDLLVNERNIDRQTHTHHNYSFS